MDASFNPCRGSGKGYGARHGTGLADLVALDTRGAAARARGDSRRRGLLAEPLGLLRGWLLVAVVLLARSVLHDYLWPSAYGGDMRTTADALSLSFAVVVAVGGISELRRVASEALRS